jgi:pimeloyl-ACP methyl ester carboxylesterase
VGILAVPGGQLYYEDAGAGPTVVLLHAGLLDLRMWDEQFALLSMSGYRTIRYDARGHGRSSTPTAAFGHHEDLRALLDARDVANATLVGLSLGARTSLDFTLTYPDVVDGLVLAGPGMSGMTFTDPFIHAEGARTMAARTNGDPAGFVEGFLRQWVDGPRRAPSDVDPAIRARCREMATQTAEAHWRDEAEWVEVGAADRLGELRVPLVALLGDLDSLDIERVVDALAATVPGARKVVVPGAGHMVNLEQPEVFNRELLGFLSR